MRAPSPTASRRRCATSWSISAVQFHSRVVQVAGALLQLLLVDLAYGKQRQSGVDQNALGNLVIREALAAPGAQLCGSDLRLRHDKRDAHFLPNAISDTDNRGNSNRG